MGNKLHIIMNYGLLWVSVAYFGLLWVIVGYRRLLWVIVGWVLLVSVGWCWLLSVIIVVEGPARASVGRAGCHHRPPQIRADGSVFAVF